MEIVVTRLFRGVNSTLSIFEIDGKFVGGQFILEDRDRGLTSSMSLEDIKQEKVYGKTAIPTGRYRVKLTYSPRFKRILPILISVPGFAGIRIHSGNSHEDTEGCLLPGSNYRKSDLDYFVGASRIASGDLRTKIEWAFYRNEEVWIEIKQGYK